MWLPNFTIAKFLTIQMPTAVKDDDEWYDDENQNEKFDSSFIISQLKSNIAYSEKSSLIAKKNVSVVKFDILIKQK